MSENINIGATVESWAEITVREWKSKINALNIGVTGDLYDSLEHRVIGSGENIERVRFSYNGYGIFVNFGVGKTKRVSKKAWFSPVIYRECQILSRLMAERYGMKAANMIITSIKK
jgi:hypothetical protein